MMPLVFCRPADPDEYIPERRAQWEALNQRALETTGLQFAHYPDSVEDTCDVCGVRVMVGPRQWTSVQEVGRQNVSVQCALCVVLAIKNDPDPTVRVLNLDNPEGKQP